ncbi:PHP domain protein [uncultured archaeon]|nr:PHP domain protein [uncultured archaeon]
MTKKFDLHSHSIFSPDSITPVEKLIDRYVALGFSGFALTDHGSIDGWKRAKDYIHKKKLELEFIPACEFITKKGDVIGLYITEMVRSNDPLEIIDSIHSQGGLAILPHPFDGVRGSACHPDKLGKEGVRKLDGMEVINAPASRGANEKSAVFPASHLLAATGGSDTHFLFETGKAFTQVPDGISLATAIRKKSTSAGGERSPIFVHGPTTLVKLGKKARLLPRA